MKRGLKIFLLLSLISGLIFAISYEKTRDYLLQFQYDWTHNNVQVISQKQIDEILGTLEKIAFKNLENTYRQETKSNELKYKNLLSNSQYYKIQQKHLNQKIVGNFRIKDFVCKDKIYRKCLYDKKQSMYWLIDKKLLYKVLQLQEILTSKGYDKDAFWIRYGHRHPLKNELVRGAKSSKHIKGQAADLVIQDINKDGQYTELDKEIVLELADKKIIGNEGGVGKYPDTRTIHIDVRGYRARWDTY